MPYRPQNTFPLDVKKSLSLSLSIYIYIYVYIYMYPHIHIYLPLLLRPESKVVKPMKTMISNCTSESGTFRMVAQLL